MDNNHDNDDNQVIATEEQLEAALAAGFSGEEYNEPEIKEPDNSVDPELKADDANGGDSESVTNDDGVDEWAGVPEAIRAKFETLGTELTRVQNIANSASGRASKLQGALDRQANEQTLEDNKPQLTSDQLRGAMGSKEKREALREDFSDFAQALDEMDDHFATSVGTAIDNLRTEFQTSSQQSSQDFEIRRNLDIRHPGWETTVLDDTFKNWVYKDGPTEEERTTYENTLSYAQSLHNNSPTEANALYNNANTYYNDLLAKYPTWAASKGSLYGDPSGDAALSLLDMHKKSLPAPTVTEPEIKDTANTQIKNQQRLADNVAPTHGTSLRTPPDTDQDVEAAFSAGFNS